LVKNYTLAFASRKAATMAAAKNHQETVKLTMKIAYPFWKGIRTEVWKSKT